MVSTLRMKTRGRLGVSGPVGLKWHHGPPRIRRVRVFISWVME